MGESRQMATVSCESHLSLA